MSDSTTQRIIATLPGRDLTAQQAAETFAQEAFDESRTVYNLDGHWYADRWSGSFGLVNGTRTYWLEFALETDYWTVSVQE